MLEGKNLLALIGGALAVVGVFLPWISIPGFASFSPLTIDLPGTGDIKIMGYLTLLAGGGAIGLQFLKKPFVGIVTMAVCGVIFALLLLNLVRAMSGGMGSAIGFGMYACVLGLGVAAFGGFQEFQKSRQA